MNQTDPSRAAIARRGLIAFFMAMVIWAACLFCPAGTLAWGRGWLQWGVMLAAFIVNHIVLTRVNPEVLLARTRNTRPTSRFDRALLIPFRVGVFLMPVIAGYDAVRFHWSAMSPAWIAPGVALILAGDGVILWSMAVNKFLETTVRIQSERGHAVVSSGPYRIVRHPMYVGCALLFAGIPLTLGSWWGCLPAAVAALALFVRTGFEDAMLRRELPGYAAFAQRTRWRLLPGVW